MKILFFGPLRDAVGAESENIAIESPARLQEVIKRLRDLHPEAATIIDCSAVSVNLDYVNDENLLVSEGDEIAVVPPVSAG